MNTEVDVIDIKITSDGTGAIKDIDKLTASLTKFADAAEKVNSTGDLSALERVAKSTSDFASSVKSIRTLNSALNSINKTCEQFDTSGAITGIELLGEAIRDNFSEADLQRIRDFADAFRGMRAIKEAPSALESTSASSGQVDAEASTQRVANGYSVLQSAINRVSSAYSSLRNIAASANEKLAKGVSQLSGTMRAVSVGAKAAAVALKYTAGAPMLALGKAFTRLKAQVANFFAMFKRRLLYRLINSVISTISNGLKEGINNVYQYSKAFGGTFANSMDRAATSVLYLKNSLGAMAAPLLNMLIPILEKVIKKVVEFINVLNRLFAQISGASTWTHALMYPHEYAEAIDDATQAAKKWKATVLGIDELNLMADNSNNNGSSNNSGVDYGSMFEELPVPDNSILGHFFDPLLKAWNTTGAFVMNAWDTALAGVKHLISAIGSSFNEVWQNGTGQRTCELILTILGNILLTIGNISERFAQAWEAGDTGTHIVQNLWDILNGILQLIANITGATAEWAATVDFGPLLTSIEGITGIFKELASTLEGDVLSVYENVMLPIASWVIEEAAPKSIEAVDAALKVLKDTYDLIKPALEWLWEKFLKPVGEWAGETFIKAIETITDLLEKLDSFLTGQTSFKEFIDSLDGIEIALLAVGTALVVVHGAIAAYNAITGVASVVGGVFGGVMSAITSPIGLVTLAIAAVIAIGALLIQNWDKIKETAVNIWENTLKPLLSRIWEGIKRFAQWVVDIAFGIANAAINIINGVISAIEALANFGIKAINAIIKALNKLHFEVPDWVPGIGGKSIGFNINEIAEVHWGRIPNLSAPQFTIPGQMFAEGGMVNAGTMFVAGEAGAEIVADIGNRTGVMNIDQMQDAVRDGITEGSEPQNALLRQILYLVSSINDKDFNPEITTGDIRRSLSRANRRDGRTVIPVSP